MNINKHNRANTDTRVVWHNEKVAAVEQTWRPDLGSNFDRSKADYLVLSIMPYYKLLIN